jgi:protein O-GlcNAc transferase
MSMLSRLAGALKGTLRTRAREPDAAPTGSPEAERLVVLAAEADGRGDHGGAEALCRQAIAIAPRSIAGWMNLGLALQFQGRLDEAVGAFGHALQIAPGSAPVLYNLARAHHAAARYGAAIGALERAVGAQPEFIDALILLADARTESGDEPGALDALRAALELEPAHRGALGNCAILLAARGEPDELLALYRRAVAASPDDVSARTGLAITLSDLGRADEALEVAERTLAAHPASHSARSIYLFTQLHSERLSMAHIAAEHRRVGSLFDSEAPARAQPFRNLRDPAKPLRVGYVSGDLRAHSVAVFLEPVLGHHDRTEVIPIAYSCVSRPDEFTRRMRPLFETWRDVTHLSDEALARVIENDGIDVLVDLSGHTSVSRLGVFARRAAPVQATWLGYINSSGMTAMDYRLSDAVLDPPGESDAHGTEAVVRLPQTYWCYRPPVRIAVADANQAAEGEIRFGSFNRYPKLSPATVRLWGTLLRELPQSRLTVVTVPEGVSQRTLLERFAAEGVDAARIELAPRLAQHDYYAAFRSVDVCLDPTPYSGATTTCDALWMGVPVVTMKGVTPISRSAASILTGAGLQAWIADTAEDYVRIALELAGRGRADAARRLGLRERFSASPVMDEAVYTRDVEKAYRAMWTQWCSG